MQKRENVFYRLYQVIKYRLNITRYTLNITQIINGFKE